MENLDTTTDVPMTKDELEKKLEIHEDHARFLYERLLGEHHDGDKGNQGIEKIKEDTLAKIAKLKTQLAEMAEQSPKQEPETISLHSVSADEKAEQNVAA